ncbi:DesA family fatty acid desaturase [Pseudomonas panipatensis]|uniref:Fatty-acid desaturase n=1 Tax=Pseudomonas panipatensis TaxID=428992 RepID=A0A1G8L0B8_9PSED|nr:fatty acid desaturase [Pseudomonas panipatensis]SDI48610.1 Fatty-acid desaturase [Pseudomonas panipatensis]SMP72995.1 Fatty-acid desaturase [Pseudomonas panipatensis]
MWYFGILDLSVWSLIVTTLVLTHLTTLSVTLYLHRYSAHRAIELHAALKHFFRFWLWLTTGMKTREWTAIHRKHHAQCETREDPHSPRYKGLATVVWQGAELYRAEARNPETLCRYGKNCPDDWLERKLYSRFPNAGVTLMVVLDIGLFGVLGLTVWAVQMMWIAFWAAGVVNGLGHAVGYRNFECRDAATNLLPWGVLICGEELHNNHHTYPGSAKLSIRPWEFDLGWAWLRLLSALRLARVVRVAPVAHRVPGKRCLDSDTAMAILRNRFLVMAQYRQLVIAPLAKQELALGDASRRRLIRRGRRLLWRETSLLNARQQALVSATLSQSPLLGLIYQKRMALQRIWAESNDLSAAIGQWVQEAEASGIRSLREFADLLRSYAPHSRGDE